MSSTVFQLKNTIDGGFEESTHEIGLSLSPADVMLLVTSNLSYIFSNEPYLRYLDRRSCIAKTYHLQGLLTRLNKSIGSGNRHLARFRLRLRVLSYSRQPGLGTSHKVGQDRNVFFDRIRTCAEVMAEH